MKIHSEKLTANIVTKGAELISLIKNTDNCEYIWQADPTHWARHTPVLFPIVGKLSNNSYTFEGKTYSMGQHGFARDREFVTESQSENAITLLLKSDAESLAIYPFDFELRLHYKLENSSLITAYSVKNTGNKDMFFSIGGHPAFNCPLNADEKRSDYVLTFNKPEKLSTHLLTEGLFDGTTALVTEDGNIPITDHLFDKDALVFKNIESTNVVLRSNGKEWMKFHYMGFPYLGIWSKNESAPFVCIEPWYGLADSHGHDGDLTKKEGIMSLAPDQEFSCDYRVSIY